MYLCPSFIPALMNLKPVQLIHLAFCTAILLFAGTVLFLNMETLKFDFSVETANPIEIVAPIMMVASLFMGTMIFNKMIAAIDETSSISAKLIQYQTAFLVKCAFFESAALLNIVVCLMTSNVLFMIFAAVPFFGLWFAKPTKDKVYSTLQLHDSDLFNGV
jgi:hypothetical protein